MEVPILIYSGLCMRLKPVKSANHLNTLTATVISKESSVIHPAQNYWKRFSVNLTLRMHLTLAARKH